MSAFNFLTYVQEMSRVPKISSSYYLLHFVIGCNVQLS